MIEKISATNLKGHSFSHQLEKINIIIGENAQGKSAIVDAILIAQLGYHPRLGKRNEDIFRLASGQEMTLDCEQKGLTQHWRYFKSSDSVKRVGEEYQDRSVNSIMLDSQLYFELSSAKRIELVASLVEMPETAKPAQIIASVKNIRLESNTEHSEGILEGITAGLRNIKETNVLKWLDSGLTQLRDSLKLANANRKRMTAVVTGIEQLRAKDAEAVNQTRFVESKLAEAREKLAGLQTTAGQLTAEKANVMARNNRREQLSLVKELPASKELTMQIRAAQTEVAEKQSRITKRKIHTHQYALMISAKESAVLSYGSECAKLIQQIQKIKANLVKMLEYKNCPTCKAPGTAWKKSFKKNEQAEIDLLEAELKEKRETINALEADVKSLQTNHAAALKEEQELLLAERSLAELQSQERELASSGEAYRAAQAELAGIGAKENIIALDQRIQTVNQTMLTTETLIYEYESKQHNLIMSRADTARQTQAVIEAQKLEAEIECLKASGQLLKDKQNELVEKAFDTLLVTVNKFTRTIIPLPILYFNGELGYQRESQWVSAETFSGSEEQALFCGLSIALASRAPFKLVVIDEMTRFIGTNKEKFIKQICALVDEGVIHQFIGCDGLETVYKVLEKQRDDFQIIRVK